MEIPSIVKSSGSGLKTCLKKKGDLATAKDDGQLDTVSVGPDGTVLTADASQPTGFKWVSGNGSSASPTWGSIIGDLSSQSDLEDALNNKEPFNTNIQAHIAATGNPHGTTKAEIGLGSVTDEAQIPKSVGTSKGSLIAFSGSATPVEVPVGADTKVLTADATQPAGVAWKAAPSGTAAWGSISGTLSTQADLQMALSSKEPANANIQSHISSTANPHNVTAAQVLPDQTGKNGKFLTSNGTAVSWGDPSSGTPPTGNGFRHVTAGAEDPTAKLVADADVAPAAAIAESKLSLNYPTHSNVNDPVAGQKAALAGTSGTPGVGNLYVTDADPRNTNARTPTAHDSSAHTGTIGTPAQVGLSNVTNDAQVKKAAASIDSNLVAWLGTTGDMVADSGKKISDLALATHNHTGVYEPANGNIQSHISSTANPHNVTAAQVLPDQTGKNGKFLTSNGATVSWGDPSSGTPPTGNGFRHVTAGAEDPTAKLVADADVAPAAAIAESKLSLNYPTHSNANDPAAGQKAALAGTSGTPGSGNKYVTDADPRNTNARTPIAHDSSAHTGAIGTPAQVGLGNVTNDAQIPKSLGTGKGSLVGFSASGTPLEVPVGANGKILTADSSQSFGVAWKDAPGSGSSAWAAITGKPEITVGDTGYGSSINDLAGALSAIQAGGNFPCVLVIHRGASCSGDGLIVPTNITLKVEKGGLITLSIGASMTINGQIVDCLHQIFADSNVPRWLATSTTSSPREFIRSDGGSWITDGYVVGGKFQVAGSTHQSSGDGRVIYNNGLKTVVNVTATNLRVSESIDGTLETSATGGVTGGYSFTLRNVTIAPTVGAVYTDGTTNFTITECFLGGATPNITGTFHAIGATSPTLPVGTLTKISGTGDTTINYWKSGVASTGLITGLNSVTGYAAGEFVTVSAGFATTGPFRILKVNSPANSIMVEASSTSIQSGVTVSAPYRKFVNCNVGVKISGLYVPFVRPEWWGAIVGPSGNAVTNNTAFSQALHVHQPGDTFATVPIQLSSGGLYFIDTSAGSLLGCPGTIIKGTGSWFLATSGLYLSSYSNLPLIEFCSCSGWQMSNMTIGAGYANAHVIYAYPPATKYYNLQNIYFACPSLGTNVQHPFYAAYADVDAIHNRINPYWAAYLDQANGTINNITGQAPNGLMVGGADASYVERVELNGAAPTNNSISNSAITMLGAAHVDDVYCQNYNVGITQKGLGGARISNVRVDMSGIGINSRYESIWYGASNFTLPPNGAYAFTISGVSLRPAIGATYSDGTTVFTVTGVHSVGMAPNIIGTVWATGATSPVAAPGTLTKQSGTGDTTIGYSVVSTVSYPYTVPAPYYYPTGVTFVQVWTCCAGGGYTTGNWQRITTGIPVTGQFKDNLNGSVTFAAGDVGKVVVSHFLVALTSNVYAGVYGTSGVGDSIIEDNLLGNCALGINTGLGWPTVRRNKFWQLTCGGSGTAIRASDGGTIEDNYFYRVDQKLVRTSDSVAIPECRNNVGLDTSNMSMDTAPQDISGDNPQVFHTTVAHLQNTSKPAANLGPFALRLTLDPSIAVATGGGNATFTRNDLSTGGSWLADGVQVGGYVTFSGFINAGNNARFGPVSNVTVSVITAPVGSAVTEGPTNNVTSINECTVTSLGEASEGHRLILHLEANTTLAKFSDIGECWTWDGSAWTNRTNSTSFNYFPAIPANNHQILFGSGAKFSSIRFNKATSLNFGSGGSGKFIWQYAHAYISTPTGWIGTWEDTPEWQPNTPYVWGSVVKPTAASGMQQNLVYINSTSAPSVSGSTEPIWNSIINNLGQYTNSMGINGDGSASWKPAYPLGVINPDVLMGATGVAEVRFKLPQGDCWRTTGLSVAGMFSECSSFPAGTGGKYWIRCKLASVTTGGGSAGGAQQTNKVQRCNMRLSTDTFTPTVQGVLNMVCRRGTWVETSREDY